MRLFLSVDLEGSTRLKQALQSNEGGSAWIAEVTAFFELFPQLLEATVDESATNDGAITAPRIWKVLGDEIIYCTKIQKSGEIASHVGFFCAALAKWNADVDSGSRKRGSLKVKGAAWLAGFPVCNVALNAPGTNAEDYFGPSLDLGFRIAKSATSRKFMVSSELAWVLLTLDLDSGIHFEGSYSIKGLLADEGYPALWIHVGGSAYVDKATQMLGFSQKGEDVRALCESYIREFGVPAHVPFIEGDDVLTEKPADYAGRLKEAVGFLRENVYMIDGEDRQAEGGGVEVCDEEAEILTRLQGQKKDPDELS